MYEHLLLEVHNTESNGISSDKTRLINSLKLQSWSKPKYSLKVLLFGLYVASID